MAKKAFFIVDVQNDFCPGGALGVAGGNDIVPIINAVSKRIRKSPLWIRLASKDWHPPVSTHFAKWVKHCVAGTNGANFHPDLDVVGAHIVIKGTSDKDDGYSGFEGHILGDGVSVLHFLREHGVKEIWICGLATDYCVKATALAAIKFGFKVFLLTDAIRAVNISADDGAKAIDEMVKAGVVLALTSGIR